MGVRITCPFSLPSSNDIQGVGFRGSNNVELILPFLKKDFLGIIGTSLEISKDKDGKYYFVVISDSLVEEQKQVHYIEKAAQYLSFLINRDEISPHYGTNYVEVEWFNFKAIPVHENTDPLLYVSESLGLDALRKVNLQNDQVSLVTYHDVLRFYFDGLRAGYEKSKYFHWFLILEHLEKSGKYKELYKSSRLFDEGDVQQLRNLAETMSDKAKKDAICSLLSRTKESRDQKLLAMINMLSITDITGRGKKEQITPEIIKRLIVGRNSLFHAGSGFPEDLLWDTLFPLVTQIVDRVLCYPNCLQDSSRQNG